MPCNHLNQFIIVLGEHGLLPKQHVPVYFRIMTKGFNVPILSVSEIIITQVSSKKGEKLNNINGIVPGNQGVVVKCVNFNVR
jgi:hypothetical protein